jgi:hypothetical protein
MQLVQILLPLRDNEGRAFEKEAFDIVLKELSGRFGGSTAYTRSPAEGIWQSGSGAHLDDIVVVEVMVDTLDKAWWRSYRKTLAERFRQKELVVRAQSLEIL